MPLPSIISSFEQSIKQYIANNVGNINFSHPQYKITKISDNNYDIMMSLTGMGVQHYNLVLKDDTFQLSGKVAVVGSGAAFPVTLIGDLINKTVDNWLKNTVEGMALVKAQMAVQKAKAAGKSVNAVITLMPEGTTENTVKTATPLKTLVVNSDGTIEVKKR